MQEISVCICTCNMHLVYPSYAVSFSVLVTVRNLQIFNDNTLRHLINKKWFELYGFSFSFSQQILKLLNLKRFPPTFCPFSPNSDVDELSWFVEIE